MRLLLLLFPALVASIDLQMAGKVYFEYKYIYGGYNARGVDQRLATDHDRTVFHIQDEELETAIEWYFGKKPDRIIWTRDSPWGDVYSTHRWNPVGVELRADPPELVNMTTENVVFDEDTYENPSQTLERDNISMSDPIHFDIVTSLWTNPHRLEGNDVNIRIYIEAEDDFARMEHTCAFGVSCEKDWKILKTLTAPVELAPGQRVIAKLEAKKGTLEFRVPYTASLTGIVAVYYEANYKNASFHGLNINSILNASHRPMTLNVYQLISYEFYYGQTLKILNAEDGHTVIKSFTPEGGHRRKAAVAKHAAETGKKIMTKEGTKLFKFTEEELKAVVDEIMENQLDEESSEATASVGTAHAEDATEKH